MRTFLLMTLVPAAMAFMVAPAYRTSHRFPPATVACSVDQKQFEVEKPTQLANSVGATELAIAGLAIAGIGAVTIEHAYANEYPLPFLAIAVAGGVLLAAGESSLPGKGAGRKSTRISGLTDGISSARMSQRPAESPPDGVQCYIVDGVEDDGEPFMVCTAEPQEFAWFNGIKRSQLKPIESDAVLQDGTVSCEEETSFNGSPEWFCK